MHNMAPRPCFFMRSRARSVRYFFIRSQLTRCCQSNPAMPKFAVPMVSPELKPRGFAVDENSSRLFPIAEDHIAASPSAANLSGTVQHCPYKSPIFEGNCRQAPCSLSAVIRYSPPSSGGRLVAHTVGRPSIAEADSAHGEEGRARKGAGPVPRRSWTLPASSKHHQQKLVAQIRARRQERWYGIGPTHTVTLKEARERARAARLLLL